MAFRFVYFETAVLRPLCCAIRSIYETPAELGVHLVQLPQWLRVQVEVYGIQGDRDDIMDTHLRWVRLAAACGSGEGV
jgi:hypothetical protein